MKNYIKTFIILTLALGVFSCSNDHSGNDTSNNTVLVKTETHTNNGNFGGYNLTFTYDEQGRTTKFTYEDLFIYWESEETYPNSDRPLSYIHVYLDASKKITQSLYKGLRGVDYAYKNTYTYDDQGRIIEVYTEEQYYDSTGTPVTNFEPYEIYNLTWDENNNMISKRREFLGGNNGGNYSLTTYSGFEEGPKNTLKTKNYGFDFYGSFAYQSSFSSNDAFDKGYGSEYLPTTITEGGYNIETNESNGYLIEYEVSYVTDSSDRIVERKVEYLYDDSEHIENYYFSYY